jgi:hypothetical protein
MMDKSNVVYKINGRDVSKSKAESSYTYSKYFYGDGANETKIEMYTENELMQIAYPNIEKPFDQVLNSHFALYPSVIAEVWLPKQSLSDGGYSYLSYVYLTKSELYLARRCYFDKLDNLVKAIDLDIDSGEELGRTEYLYDELNELVRLNEYDKFGNHVGKMEFDKK